MPDAETLDELLALAPDGDGSGDGDAYVVRLSGFGGGRVMNACTPISPVPVRVIGMRVALLLLGCSEPAPEQGHLSIQIVDAQSGQEIPARVELLDEAGTAWVPPQALPLRFECFAAPLPEWAAHYVTRSNRIKNRPQGSEQFYLDGPGELDLPVGRYRLRAFRGIETTIAEREIEITPGSETRVELALERWADMASEGWWSVDDHVHITRESGEADENIAAWMQAEDLRVANLLQMGTVDQVSVTPQHDFGDAGAFRRGDTLLLAGQEHPRTHFLGHTITLGADALIDQRETYIDYETTFREALRRNGLPGYAHWGIGPARTGLSLDAPRGLVFFLEVLQFDFPWYREWYDLLDLGIRITPTAGTDFPCGLAAGLPGRERFYVRLDAPPTRASLVAAVRAGRTFVSNGPLLDLQVRAVGASSELGDAGIGDELVLDGPGRVAVRARVRFDPSRDDVQHVELVVNGEAQPLTPEEVAAGDLRIETDVALSESSWLALRVRGNKLGETPQGPTPTGALVSLFNRAFDFREATGRAEDFYESQGRIRPSAAHTAAIYAVMPGTAPTARQQQRAREAMARLDDLEARLGDDRIADQTLWDWIPYSDAVPEEHLRHNRPALLAAIAEARAHYTEIVDAR